jgi:type IV pilus assembly protein PilY1
VSGGASARRNTFRKTPFFNIASNIVQPETGWLRSFLGTGDKQHLRTKVESACGPDNLLACVRLKCDVQATFVANINGRERTTVIEYDDGALVRNEESWLGTQADVCNASRMELTSLLINCPDSTTLGSGSFRFPLAGTATSDSECARSGTDWSCSNAKLPVAAKGQINLGTDAAAFPMNRYYGFHSYGGPRRFTTATEALGFDQKRVTDIPFNCGTGVSCSLANVTIPESAYAQKLDANGRMVTYLPKERLDALPRGGMEGPGWFMQYRSLQEKTASGSTVLGGVVLWPSFTPPASTGSVCSLQGAGDITRTWQTDVITGLPDMAEGFRMYDENGVFIGYMAFKQGSSAAPPSDPTPVISLSETGGIRFEAVMPGVGDALSTERVSDRKNVTPDVYWLEVPHNLHACRHEGNCD